VVLVLDTEAPAERRARKVRDIACGEYVVVACRAPVLVDDDAVVDRASASSTDGRMPRPATTASPTSVLPEPSVTDVPSTAATVSPFSTSTPWSR